MGEMLFSSFTSRDSPRDLVDILPCRFDKVTLPMLGAAFFEQGWLAPSWLDIHSSNMVALGDVGYVTEAGGFVVVDNVHRSLPAESGTLSWEEHLKFHSGGKQLKDTSAEIIISRSGKSYQRRRQVHFLVYSDPINQIAYSRLCPLTIPAYMQIHIDLEYENLEEMHAWKLLQHDAHSTITRHGLSISPHELMLGQWRHTSRNSS